MADPVEYPPNTVILRLSLRDKNGDTAVTTVPYTVEEGASSITQLDLLEMAGETAVRRLAEDLHLHRYAAQAERELAIHDELRGDL